MEVGLFIVGAIVGWGAALLFDVLYYRESKSFTRALAEAQARIDSLQLELAELRRQNAERPETPMLFLDTHIEETRPDADHQRIAELESRLEELRRESAESERRAHLFEARLTDATSELASLRYGLPTLERKAEDELESPLS